MALGCGIPLSGFTPFNHAADLLSIQRSPALVMLMPSVVLALIALLLSRAFPARAPNPWPLPLAVGAVLLLIGSALSLFASDQPTASAQVLVTGILAPIGLAVGIMRAELPQRELCIAFLVTSAALWLRADAVFFIQHGLPTGHSLFVAKYTNRPYDFHYYGLDNPNESAAFLVIPLTLAAFWLPRASGHGLRVAVFSAGAVAALSLLLCYVRVDLVIGLLVVVSAVLASRATRIARYGITAALAAAAAAFLAMPGVWHYLSESLSTTSNASAVVRWDSIVHGLETILNHPVTGVGLGRYGVATQDPAHSILVQAGAEAGLLAFAGALAVIGWLGFAAVRAVRRDRATGLESAATLAAGVFALQAVLLSGFAAIGSAAGNVSVWALSLALMVAVGHSGTAAEPVDRVPSTVGAASTAGRLALDWLRSASKALLEHRRRLLVGFGLAVAAIAVAVVSQHAPPDTLIGSRTVEVHDAIAAWNRGAPPLTGFQSGVYYPLDGTDHGISMYLPLLGRIASESNPDVLMKWFYLAALVLPIVLYPIVFDALLGSLAIAMLAPLLLLYKLAFTHFADIYWVYAWAPLTALPVLMVAYKRWGTRSASGCLLATLVFASFANTVRGQSGLPVALSALILLLVVSSTWRRKLLIGVACTVAYLSVTPGLFSVITAARDSELTAAAYHGRVIYPPFGTTSGFWHSAYIGLALEPNHHGLPEMTDEVAAAYAAKVKPTAWFLSPEYEQVLMNRFFDLLRTDPGFVVGTETKKALLTIDDGIRRDPLLLVLLPPLLLFGRRRGLLRVLFLLAVTVPVVLLAPPVVSMPYSARITGYEFGFFGGLALLWILAVAFALRYVLDGFASGLLPRRGWTTSARHALATRRARACLLLVTGGIVGAVALTIGTAQLRATRDELAHLSPSVVPPIASSDRFPAAAWSLEPRLPAGWTAVHGTRLRPDSSGLAVTTTTERLGYQLLSPTVHLVGGLYRAELPARIVRGGLALSVLDVATQRFLATGLFRQRQTLDGTTTLPLDFMLYTPTRVQLVLSNGLDTSASSLWELHSASILGPKQPPLTEIARWAFSSGIPEGWQAAGGARTTTDPSGVRIDAGPHKFLYQLVSPPVDLEQGVYQLSVLAHGAKLGFGLGVLDGGSQRWIDTRLIPGGPTDTRVTFDIPFARSVQVVFFSAAAGSTFSVRAVSLRGPAQPRLRSFAGWRFSHGLPTGWLTSGPASISTSSHRARIVTNGAAPIQVTSTFVRLPAGHYELRARASVVVGSVQVGLVDASRGGLESSLIDHTGPGRVAIRTEQFDLTYPADVGVVFATPSGVRAIQSWLLIAASIVGRPAQPPKSVLVDDWTMRGLSGLSRWTPTAGATTSIDPQRLLVATSNRPNAYQLTSPVSLLGAGHYELTVNGAIALGAVGLGILDNDSQTWITTRAFGWPGPDRGPFHLDFDVTKATHVQVVAFNGGTTPAASRWLLQSASLQRLIPPPQSHALRR